MKISMVHWISALALCATSLTGCGERTEARPPAPVASR
jgi:predicted small secreted protein